MSDQSTIRADLQLHDPDQGAAVLAARQLWQRPLALYTNWWNAGVEAL